MKKTLKKTMLSVLAVCTLVGVYFLGCDDRPKYPSAEDTVKSLREKHHEVIVTFQRKTDVLVKSNDSLSKIVREARDKMQDLKQQVKLLRGTVMPKLETAKEIPDTVQYIQDCEELKTEVSDLIQFNQQQDSICELTVEDYERLVGQKDTLLTIYYERIFRTDSLFNSSMHQQEFLTDQLRLRDKEVRKKHRQNALLGAGLLLFSTSSLILFLLK